MDLKNKKVEEAQKQKIQRDQLITLGDLEIFKQELIEEFKTIVSATSASSKKWLKSSEVKNFLEYQRELFKIYV